MIKLLSLFSGIGAFEKALTNLNIEYELINYCEIDKYASKAYCLIHDENEKKNLWDITKVNEKELRDFDLMTYGFPCQPFSMAGLRTGKEHKKGNLFFDSMRIAKYKNPKWMIAENVKGLLSIENGNYLEDIILYLDRIGYNNYFKILNAKDYGIPQNRERLFIVSIRKDIDNLSFEFPKKQKYNYKNWIEKNVDKKYYLDLKKYNFISDKKRIEKQYTKIIKNYYDIILCQTARQYVSWNGTFIEILGHIENISRESSKRIYNEFKIIPTLTTMEGGNTKPKIYNNSKIRRLIPLECFRLMGFSDNDFNKLINFSDNKLYKMAGNSIVVNVLETIFKQLFLNDNKRRWLF